MASPQVSAEGQVALNPPKTGSYTIKLSDRIANPRASQAKFKTVKYNHKPRQTVSRRTTRIKPTSNSPNGKNFTLAIEDRDDQGNCSKYEYEGQRKELKKTYVLLLDPNSNSCTLERLDDAYAFNLTSTPLESDSNKLKENHPQIRLREEREDATEESLEDDGLFDDASETQSIAGSSAGASDFDEPEENNPYDFRRFLDQVQQVDTNGFASPNSHAGTPLRVPSGSTARTTPLLGAQQSKPPKPLPKATAPKADRPVATSKSKPGNKKPNTTSPKKAKPTDTPSIRLERVASIAATAPALARSTTDSPRTSHSPAASDEESDDEGGLQIDFGDGGPPKRGRARPSAFAFENVGDGPISLRSAADSASPSSRLQTPSFRGSKEVPDVIDFGGDNDDQDEDDDAQEVNESRLAADENYASDHEEDRDALGHEDVDADGSVDGDVEPMNLGSPAQQPDPSHLESSSVPLASSEVDEADEGVDGGAVSAVAADEDGDFADEFEAEMEQALASAAEQEESEESEEE
ncbi:hypothetical protein IWX90DRAFT_421973 [Phyllosticta citrichinensis]|uniref:Transcription elongation factor Eaf N-terminal domain-containing protein n=1 Tax=Phyllosticta citrichinensis TaxID=1130410 RepID=A0ABR1Y7U4_9PEZI